MGILDNASYYLGRGIGSADKAAKGLKIQAEVTKLEAQRRDLIQQLGMAVYAKSESCDTVKQLFLDEIGAVLSVDGRMEACRGQLAELQSGSSVGNYGASAAVCASCGMQNPVGSAFCMGCGKKLNDARSTDSGWICSDCGGANSEGTRFCIQCGSPMPQKEEQSIDTDVNNSVDGHEVASGEVEAELPIGTSDAKKRAAQTVEGPDDSFDAGGEQTPHFCPRCGSAVMTDDAFCGECGQPL